MIIYEPSTQKEYDVDLRRTSGEEQITCPACSHLRKKKTLKCFSWSHDKQLGRCAHCESSFVIKSEMQSTKKEYFVPVFKNTTELSDKVVKYFKDRKISPETLNHFKVTEGMQFMPQDGREMNTIQYNYFRDGKLVNTKFRTASKHFKLVKDAELILYNLDAIKDSDEMLIVEGEADCLSWHEAGYKFCVSVPNGAGKNQKLEWIENCYSYLENKTKIYIATDDDEPGHALREELGRRLGYDRCFKVDLQGYKDSNDLLKWSDKENLFSTLKSAKEFPIKGVFTIEDEWDDILDIYNNGMPTGAKSGDKLFDEHLGLMPGELTMVTGIPSHGKSIYLDQISIGLCRFSDWRFGVCSPESHPASFYFTRLIKRLVGKKFTKHNINTQELNLCKEWMKDRYHLIKPDEGYSLDLILESARMLVVRKGIKGLILDPWNRIESGKPNGITDGEWIVSCLVKIITFAQKNGVHVFLVAHPTKMQKAVDGINYLVPNLYSISGSAHFFNMTQNGFTIFRNFVTGLTEIHFQKVKWEHLGKQGFVEYVYNEDNARFFEPGTDPNINWLTEGKFIEPPELEFEPTIRPSNIFELDDSPF